MTLGYKFCHTDVGIWQLMKRIRTVALLQDVVEEMFTVKYFVGLFFNADATTTMPFEDT